MHSHSIDAVTSLGGYFRSMADHFSSCIPDNYGPALCPGQKRNALAMAGMY